jgi:hypothetical protein
MTSAHYASRGDVLDCVCGRAHCVMDERVKRLILRLIRLHDGPARIGLCPVR